MEPVPLLFFLGSDYCRRRCKPFFLLLKVNFLLFPWSLLGDSKAPDKMRHMLLMPAVFKAKSSADKLWDKVQVTPE